MARYGFWVICSFFSPLACEDATSSSCSGEACESALEIDQASNACALVNDSDAGAEMDPGEDEAGAMSALVQGGGSIRVSAKGLLFRCRQEACARMTKAGSSVEVTFQPCDLHPKEIPRCPGCRQALGTQVDLPAGEYSVSVFHRSDDYDGASKRVLIATDTVIVE